VATKQEIADGFEKRVGRFGYSKTAASSLDPSARSSAILATHRR
jgi:hypothetical protein